MPPATDTGSKVVLASFGTLGDVLPFVGLGAELRRRDFDVTLLSNNHDDFRFKARNEGLEFVGIGDGEKYRRTLRDRDLWHPRRGLKTVVEGLLPDPLETCRTLIRELAPGGVVVAHPFAFGARLAHQKLGVDMATLVLSTCLVRSNDRVPVMYGDLQLSEMAGPFKRLMWWLADSLLIDPAVGPKLDRARRRLDLPEIRRPFDGWMFSPRLVVGMFPDWFSPPQPDWSDQIELTGFPLYRGDERVPEAVDDFLEAGPPPVVATTGSVTTDVRRFVEPVVRGCRETGRRLLFVGLEENELPETARSKQVLAAGFVPYSKILDRALALIHHGGIGTTAAGLRAGVLQIVRPVAHDQPDHADRIEKLGVGRRLLVDDFCAETVVEALDELTADPDVRRRCLRYARKVRKSRAVIEACDLIEENFEIGL